VVVIESPSSIARPFIEAAAQNCFDVTITERHVEEFAMKESGVRNGGYSALPAAAIPHGSHPAR